MSDDSGRSRPYQYLGDSRLAPLVNGWLVLLLVGLIAVLVYRVVSPDRSPLHDSRAESRQVTPKGDLAADEKAAIEIFKMASESVVHITRMAVRRNLMDLNVLEIPEGTGSGFVWDEQGHVVTNYHVIQGGQGAIVTLYDNSNWDVQMVGFDPNKDLAVLKIDVDTKRLKPILVGRSDDLQVGQKVFAIGNPFALDHTLTTGIISGLGRVIPAKQTGYPIQDVIQTDAAINPGNSGGPLLDSHGRLIGVNTAIVDPSEGSSGGIGFAVPVDVVNRVVPELIRFGKVRRSGLGIYPWPNMVVERLYLQGAFPQRGILVKQVEPGGAAAGAGILPTRTDPEGGTLLGDLIIAVDGQPVPNVKNLFARLDGREVGDEVTLLIWRSEKRIELHLRLQELSTVNP